MTRKEKLLTRFQTEPSDFHYRELVSLLRLLGFIEVKTGRTSGSRVKFVNDKGITIAFHKPHPSGIMKAYELKRIKDRLGL